MPGSPVLRDGRRKVVAQQTEPGEAGGRGFGREHGSPHRPAGRHGDEPVPVDRAGATSESEVIRPAPRTPIRNG
jgi:hypothetical protein